MEATNGTAAISAPAAEWAKVELLGHRTRFGLTREVERFGVKMVRIDMFVPGSDTPILTEMYAGTAIFGYRPCAEECARTWASDRWNLPADVRPALPVPEGAVEDGQFTEVERDERPADYPSDLPY